jgi:DHA1 family multidrug resistance protein-like MFS transporter
VYTVGILAFILFLSTLVGVPVLPNLSKDLGAPASAIPIIVSASLATVVIIQFFAGWLADRYPAKRLLLFGALLGSVSSLLCIFATHWTHLLAYRILGGLADAIAMPTLLTITATQGKDKPGKFFGILRSSQGLSYIIGPALGGVFSLISLRTPFLVDGILSLIACVTILFLMPDGHRSVEHAHHLNIFKTLKTIFADKRIYAYLLLGISGLFGFGIVYTFVPTKSRIIGLTPWQIGLIIGIGALVFSVMSLVTGIISDKGYRKHMVIMSQIIIIGSGTALALWGNGFISLLLLTSLFCIGQAIAFLLSFVYASKAFDSKYIGTAMGAFDALVDLSLLVAPLIGVSVYAATGQIALTFYLICIPAILGLFSLVFFRSFDVD